MAIYDNDIWLDPVLDETIEHVLVTETSTNKYRQGKGKWVPSSAFLAALVPVLASGTYTPAGSDDVNLADYTITDAQYIRVGSVVTVSGQVSLAIAAANLVTSIKLTLPIASTFSGASQLAGTAACADAQFMPTGEVTGSTNKAIIKLFSDADTDISGPLIWSYHYTYLIVQP